MVAAPQKLAYKQNENFSNITISATIIACARGCALDKEDEATIDTLVSAMNASHGPKALVVLAKRIKECELRGDEFGIRLWEKVTERIRASWPAAI
jgi:hypothetical protein